MEVAALIVEQLEIDGTLRTFRMAPDPDRRMVVAFSDEYAEPRSGPFHFLDEFNAQRFQMGFASAQIRRVAPRRFHKIETGYHFQTSWLGIPTKRHWLTYYALCLPEFAIPLIVRVTDPHSGREYRKVVTQDDDRNRANIYLECRSSRGLFDFVLETDFHLDPERFHDFQYQDENTDEYGRQIDQYIYLLPNEESDRVQQFFSPGSVTFHSGDNIQFNGPAQVGSIRQYAKEIEFSLEQNLHGTDIDFEVLVSELEKLITAIERAPETDQRAALMEIQAAEREARAGNERGVVHHLKNVGMGTLKFARDIGVDLVARIISQAMGL